MSVYLQTLDKDLLLTFYQNYYLMWFAYKDPEWEKFMQDYRGEVSARLNHEAPLLDMFDEYLEALYDSYSLRKGLEVSERARRVLLDHMI